jgi:hypothetical protein
MDEGYTMNVPEDPSQTERSNLARTQSLARVHRMLGKKGEARRWRFEIIQGTARNVTFHSGDTKATIEVDGRRIQLEVPGGDPIALSEGDEVLIAARLRDPSCGSVYFNETTGIGSIDSTHSQARRMLIAGAIGALAAVAIILTTALAARGDSHFSGIRVVHIAMYLVSTIVSGAIFVFSCFLFTIGLHMRKVCALVRFVADGR